VKEKKMKLKMESKVEAAIVAFRIFHGITEEIIAKLDSKELCNLWLEWRVKHDLPLKKEEWELHHNCWEIIAEGLSIYHEGKRVGELNLTGPISPELADLLEETKAA
jgi:hypothetical protein